MRFFELTGDGEPTRDRGAAIGASVSLTFAIVYGGSTFGAVSALAYAIWAFDLISGTAAMYSTIAAVYVGLAGLALSRLVAVPGAWIKFPFFFAFTFLVFAIVWCAFWFGLKGKFHADLYGSAVGLAAMTWLFQRAFGMNKGGFLSLFGVLFTFHTLGYQLGDELHTLVRGPAGRLLWGAAHGIGFGAGLGNLLFYCQPQPLERRDAEVRRD